jgi:hypothetical protein
MLEDWLDTSALNEVGTSFSGIQSSAHYILLWDAFQRWSPVDTYSVLVIRRNWFEAFHYHLRDAASMTVGFRDPARISALSRIMNLSSRIHKAFHYQ